MNSRLVLFVCTGNICRSPMAEYLLRKRLGADSAWSVASAGLAAPDGMPASVSAVEALRDIGIDLRPHRSRLLTTETIAKADPIVVMTSVHRAHVRRMTPEAARKVYLLSSFDPGTVAEDVEDPIGMSAETYRWVRDRIDDALPGLIQFLRAIEKDERRTWN